MTNQLSSRTTLLLSKIRGEFLGWFCRQARKIFGENSPLRPNANDRWGRIAVIGRSASADYFAGLQTAFDTVILCNFRDSDIEAENLRAALRDSRKIVILSNLLEPKFSCKVARELPIRHVIWLGFDKSREHGRKRTRWRLEEMGMPVESLPADFDSRWLGEGAGKNTGLMGVRLATLLSRDISIFGIDFYQIPHLKPSESDFAGFGLSNEEYRNDLPKAFIEIVRENPHIAFRHYTDGPLRFSEPNLSYK